MFCRAYGIGAGGEVVEATLAAVAANVERLRSGGRVAGADWWQSQFDWLDRRRVELAALLPA